MKPIDDDGRELDAIFTVEPTASGAYLILESRGGGEGGPRPPRNADYGKGLELLLRRLGQQSATLGDVEVYSRVTSSWPPEKRRITAPDFPLPINLAEFTETQSFRYQLGGASAALGRAGNTGGNPTKKLRLKLDWPNAVGKDSSELEGILAGLGQKSVVSVKPDDLRYGPLGKFLLSKTEAELRLNLDAITEIIGFPLPKEAWKAQFWANTSGHHRTRRRQWLDAGYEAFFERHTETVLFRKRDGKGIQLEEATDDPDELRRRTQVAKRKIRDSSQGIPPSPPGKIDVGERTTTSKRYLRDPNVIAWVLIVANGHCEVCNVAAPFIGIDGEPFLEVHHVRPLSEGGPDVTDNAVAACPNCHRRLHFSADRETVRADTIAKIDRLKDHPMKKALPSNADELVTFAEMHPEVE